MTPRRAHYLAGCEYYSKNQRGKSVADKIKRADGIIGERGCYEEKRALWKVGAWRRLRGACAGERRDDGSRDATPGANEARRRYPADKAS